ncbi:MAG: hypothetical protein IPI06_11970 [Gammaproteobacteria bacterium]|nr:hypothetical protein [Gammaproteobacteria bacterium]
MDTLTIERRFRGPAQSAHGGYFSGRIARFCDQPVRVRLRAPPPLDVPLAVTRQASGHLEIRQGGRLIGEAEPAGVALEASPPVDYVRALEASQHYAGFHHHVFPECFVCGPKRARPDGLRVFAGPVGDGRVAAPWMPDASLAEGDGKVAAEFMWAALDCPGYFAVSPDSRPMLLAEFTAHVDRRVHALEPCVIVAWPVSSAGRRHEAGTALYDEDGEPCARARALWIEPRV